MRRITLSATLLLAFACSKDPAPSNPPPSNTGGSRPSNTGGARPPGSGGVPGTGGTTVPVFDGSPGQGGSTGDATAEVGGETGGGEVGGGDAPGGAGTYLLVSAGADYGTPSPITTVKLDTTTGALTKGGTVTGLSAVVFGGIAPNKKFAFFTTEEDPAKVVSFAIDSNSGALTKIGEITTGAPHGEYVGVHPNGNWLAIAHYGGGQVTVHPIMADGKVGAPSDTKQAAMPMMADCHQAIFDPAGANLFVTCKKMNVEHIAQFRFAAGKLTANTPPTIMAPGGVRHLAFAKNEKFAYGITEADTSVITYAYDKATGKLTQIEKVPAFIADAAKAAGSHILIHPNGNFLYVGSRWDNAIIPFSIDATTGKVTKKTPVTDGISFPRNFEIEPSGNYLIVGNQPNDGSKVMANKKDGGDLVVFKIDGATGGLTKVGTPIKLDPMIWYIGAVNLP